MKVCFKCQQPKARSEFYGHPQMGDGLLGKCKECTKLDASATRLARIDHYRAYDRARGNRQVGYGAIYAEKHPIRRAAQVALNNALRDGRVDAWPVCALPECEAGPEAHHTHYDAPLEVVWLCPAHHKQAHAMARKS
jgi:hypothetical protein